MNLRARLLVLCSLISALGLVFTHFTPVQAQGSKTCPTSALERFQRYRASRGDTLESIAQRYKLSPETIVAMNPALKNSRVAVGSEILIPPLDGIVVEVPKGNNWQELAEIYRVRADALFELNGCKAPSRFAFIPTPNKSPSRASTSVAPTSSNPPQIAGYPLPEVAQLGFPYGWQIHPGNGQVFFHSGIDLLAAKGTAVSAIAPGTVVFAGEQGTYGKLVIINHDGGLQSRYAQLDSINVKVNQQVKQGDLLGTVGTSGQPTINQPHLHFEVRSNSSLGWAAKDPKGYLQR
ncbi:M23 family metallopeptidase [Chlorogloeopsis sp. ULAP01]|uniref:LysM peptidoglycan-binding domain-containing M23 family metallopeptidase n=1 Tax=Chlorogloeopsis sp. ULAP01 TaxID=3056483 RepID=UPI0025AB574D|nr:M23 family metallopeptidase [Chlorogloeopsis sp. ULAP01]MDM9381542.1 M23 family metallopeptidase [Chlorogloeopsis sp. ULAP01]